MTMSAQRNESLVLGRLMEGGSAYFEVPDADTVIRVSAHFPKARYLMTEPPTMLYGNVFWMIAQDFIDPKRGALNTRLLEAVNLINLGKTENGYAIIEERISAIEEKSGKNVAYNIIAAGDGNIIAKIDSIKSALQTRGFPYCKLTGRKSI